MKVDVFIPCFIDQLKPETARSVFRVLQQVGVEIHYPDQQTCCGQMAFNAGFWDEVKQLGEKFLKEFSGDRYVVIPSASCAHMVRHHYSRFFYNTSMHLEFKKLQTKAIELSDFLINVAKVQEWPGKLNATVTLHDSCSAIRDYGLKDEPRRLLEMIGGLNFVEMNKSTDCCGFGGSFSIKYPQLSTDMAIEKLKNATESGAEYLITTETSCLLQLESVAEKHNIPIKILTLADALALSLRYSDSDL